MKKLLLCVFLAFSACAWADDEVIEEFENAKIKFAKMFYLYEQMDIENYKNDNLDDVDKMRLKRIGEIGAELCDYLLILNKEEREKFNKYEFKKAPTDNVPNRHEEMVKYVCH